MFTYFSYHELKCKCGCNQLGFTDDFLERLDQLREAYGKPIIISSGYRCPEYNAEVSSTGSDGPHTCCAVDISVMGQDAHRLLSEALKMNFKGIGIKQKGLGRFIHLDDMPDQPGPRPWIWSY